MPGDKARQKLFGSPSDNAAAGSPSRLPMNASATVASPPALPPPDKGPAASEAPPLSTASAVGSGSFSSSMRNTTDLVALSKLPASPIRPAMGSSSPPPLREPVSSSRTWQSAAASGPPPDLVWSPTVERLIMNSTKQVEALEQVGQQAVTVLLGALPPLRKLSRSAASSRDRYNNSVRLAMRRGAIGELIDASAALLRDLAHLFALLGGQASEAGKHGRTHGRRVEALVKDLEGGRLQFAAICKEMKLAGRFMLMRDPVASANPDLEERVVEEGQKDTRQLESVLRSVTNSRNKLRAMWATLAALQRAGVTPDDAAWPLLRGLDISTTADVLATLQLDPKPPAKEAAAAREEADANANPSPLASPGLGRAWWRSGSIGRSPRKGGASSPAKGAAPGAKSPLKRGGSTAAVLAAAADGEARGNGHAVENGLPNGNGIAHEAPLAPLQNGTVDPAAQEQVVEVPVIQIRNLKNGAVYRGGVERGAKSGLGQFEYANGDVYDGQFAANSMHGYGVYTFASGGLYQGQWEDGQYSGLGVETFPTGGTYHGAYAAGARSGWGACSFANGDYFEGQWANGARHGRGMQQCPDHSSFVGTYVAGRRDGHGCYTFGNGDRYMGEYKDDVPHGAGVYLFASGQTHEGLWEGGSKHGWCVYSLANGQQWAGRWAKGRPVWMQHMGAAQADAKAEGGKKAEAVASALAAAADARKAANVAGAYFKDHWQPEGPLQAAVRQAVQRAVAAAETAASVQEGTQEAVRAAVAAAEAAAAARRKRR